MSLSSASDIDIDMNLNSETNNNNHKQLIGEPQNQIITATAETENETQTETETDTPTLVLPLILDGKFYKVKSQQGTNVKAECVTCKKNIKGRTDATTNFRTHLKTKGHSLAEFEAYKSKKLVHPKKRGHPLEIECNTTNTQPQQKKLRQSTLTSSITVSEQAQADKLISNYIVQTMNPQVLVEHEAFKNLIKGICQLKGPINVPTRKTLAKRIDANYQNLVIQLKENIQSHKYICTTADIWSCSRRSYMGITAHWINQNFERRSAALACRRFRGSHTYDRITEIILDVHNEFADKLKTQIVKTVTDNGANMVKAFAESSSNKTAQSQSESEDANAIDSEGGEDVQDDEDEGLISISHVLSPTDVLELDPTSEHQRCCSHTLNLIATSDIQKCLGDKNKNNIQYSKVHHVAFGKCSALWNSTSRSPKSSEIYLEITKRNPTSPCPTRWNSKFDCVENLLRVKDKLNTVFEALHLPKFKDNELEFLNEYMEVLRPVAEAIDKLQGSKNTFFGELIPQLYRTRKILQSLLLRNFKFCNPLLKIVLDSLERRFGDYFNLDPRVNDAILATVTHPLFKLNWAPKQKRAFLKQLLFTDMQNIHKEKKSSGAEHSQVKEKEDSSLNANEYFMFDEDDISSESGSETQPATNSTSANNVHLQALQYLQDEDVNIVNLNRYPLVKELFFKYNTPLPSSAPVERLFSYGGMIMTPKRRCMNDENFEKQLLLKANNKFS